ncbi:hypothetical protein HMPREF0526_10304 [Lactobacillus jensenii JV-V16]|nr:hypothetical protein [Lactobacillus mulieris]EFH30151.1 hypothetical protein HMPREF0526_10304 [Lactobacillus jensenii JV-V16]
MQVANQVQPKKAQQAVQVANQVQPKKAQQAVAQKKKKKLLV